MTKRKEKEGKPAPCPSAIVDVREVNKKADSSPIRNGLYDLQQDGRRAWVAVVNDVGRGRTGGGRLGFNSNGPLPFTGTGPD